MKSSPVLFCVLLALGIAAPAAADIPSWGREVRHYKANPASGKDELTGITENQSNPAKNMLTQITRSAQGIEIARREFIMDSKGRIRRGAIWDGQRMLKGRTEYGFDAYDRVNEERLFHASGRLVRRILFKYDATSRRLVDKFYILDEKNPYGPLIQSTPSGEDAKPFLPVQEGDRELPGAGLPQFRGMDAPAQKPGVVTPTAPPPQPKKGFLQKMFKRDK